MKNKLSSIFTPDVVQNLKNNKDLITSELLSELRSFGNEGKHLALEILDVVKDEEQFYVDAFGNRIAFNGNRQIKQAFTKLNLAPIHKEELEKCSKDVHYFKDNYIQIRTKSGYNFPEVRPYQEEFINTILPDEHESIIGLMGRQSGKSVSTGIYLAWLYNFREDFNIGIAANRASMAREFLNNVKTMFIGLPIWMQLGTTVWNKGSIENESGMRILTDATSGDSFRGFTCLEKNEPIEVYDKVEKKYKTITMSELYNTCSNYESISHLIIPNNRYLIKTHAGYKDFDAVKETQEKGLIITTERCQLRCTKTHKMLVNDKFVTAETLKVNDILGGSKILEIQEDELNLYYDPINVDGDNTYTSKNIDHHNCTVLVTDETAFIKSSIWDEFSDSVFPSQSGLAWKKNIMISTANGMNHFYHMVCGAREGTSGDKIVEVDWRDVPRYKSDGSRYDNEEFKQEIIAKHGAVYFAQNYSNNFAGSSYTLISSDAMQLMRTAEPYLLLDQKLKIYKEPEKGHKYIMTVDPAKDGTDAFAVQVIDITSIKFEQAASAKLQVDYLKMPVFLDEWGKYYNYALLIIENNEGAGQSIADQLWREYEYENMWFDFENPKSRKRKKYPGFRTTRGNRPQLLSTLKLFVENDRLSIVDKDTITELYTFILIKNKYQADDGAFDDMVMSLALSFTPFLSTKNFEDINTVLDAIYDNSPDAADVSIADNLTVGSFNDYTDDYVIEDGDFLGFE